MPINKQDLQTLCQLAMQAARSAGDLIARHTPHNIIPDYKTGSHSLAARVVTEVDLKSQQAILDILGESIQKWDLGLLTEEQTDNASRLKQDYFWCIDPLDGTLPFLEGRSGYGVSIALVNRAGKSVLGVAYDPLQGDLYHAISNELLYKNGKIFEIPEPTRTQTSLVIDASFPKHPDFSSRFKRLQEIINKINYPELKLIQPGGAVMNALYALENPPAFYLKLPRLEAGGGSIWDFAATACILQAAGLVVLDASGQPLNLNNPHSTFMHQRGILFVSHAQLAQTIIEAQIT